VNEPYVSNGELRLMQRVALSRPSLTQSKCRDRRGAGTRRISAVFLPSLRITPARLSREKTSDALTVVVAERAEHCFDDFRARGRPGRARTDYDSAISPGTSTYEIKIAHRPAMA
jgi:hypothetical protein